MYDPLAGRFEPTLSERTVFTEDDAPKLLYGMDSTARVVAIEPYGSNEVLLYKRDGRGRTVSERRVTSPWVLSSDLRPFRGTGDADIAELRGEHSYRYLITFPSWDAYRTATTGETLPRGTVIGPPTITQQYQLRSGLTLFKGMEYADLRRMQIDLETLTLGPAAPDAGVIMISVRQGNREEILVRDSTEEDLFERFTRLVTKLDPDVIEGHNLYRFDFPYLVHRATKVGVPLLLGRNRSLPRVVDVNGRQASVYIHGRHVIDTYQQIQRFDVSGSLSRYGLKSVIHEMGLEREDRTFVEGASIADMWRQGHRELDQLAAYALDDVRDVDALSRVIMPTMFYQTQMLPTTYQRSTLTGTGRKIDDFMFRTYLAAGHSIPRPTPGRTYAGGYAEVVHSGIFEPIVKCDVESLYPSIMLRESIASSTDVLQAFPVLLRDLTRRRIDAKRKAATSEGEARATWTALQASFKILINSFYGYLGFGGGAFNDYTAAEHVSLEGQRLIREVVQHLRDLGATPIEIDTDGAYFSPPDSVSTEADEHAFIARISDRLPTGINLAHDGRYWRMLSLKIKTYALLDHSGGITLKGSALRSRALEQCFQEFIRYAAERFLHHDRDAVRERYFNLAEAIQRRALPVEAISQWTTIRHDSMNSRRRLKRLLDEHPGQWHDGERVEVYERADGSLAFAEHYADDENVAVLLRRLHEVAERFRPLIGDDAGFDAMFPRITPITNLAAARDRKPARQLTLM
ncbi:MAG TPA: 3'-5' exonuclease [Thermomicrobiales bacterium]|nr:3'-5' exonuclease [Thermomicrobiales bacterium]